MNTRKVLRYFSAFVLIGFGLLTLFLSTSVIFDLFDIRAKEGDYVLFVVVSNFIASLFYLFSAYGFIKNKRWTQVLLGIASIVLIISFVSLKIYVSDGGVYEEKTVSAMIFRIILTVALTLIAYFTIKKYKSNEFKRQS